ncbi:hypothetical protein [Leeia oryzae]|uniref:hypothetical protein n=1 Tax=Leeia oryzae TaxID=356662 RepID=UPI00039F2E6A|nr:hypothetical protein [Leeia oryzae]
MLPITDCAGRVQEMRINTHSTHITPVSGNVFADLGFEPEEAAALKAESQLIISEKLAINESLMANIENPESS